MLVSKYSAPEFDPYGDNASDEPDETWAAPVAPGPLRARVALPGSKSLTGRELLLSALASGRSTLHGALRSRDSTAMVSALTALGTRIEPVEAGSGRTALTVEPAEELFGSTTIDCGQAGTVMRFVPPVAALALGPTVFDADASARSRPMAGLLSALRDLGVDLNDDGRGALPFTVHGTGRVAGGEVVIDASSSSQFVSALLLAAARFEEGLTLWHAGERLPSLPHIEMTVATLAARGVDVEPLTAGGRHGWRVAPGPIAGGEVTIEPDLSNAAPFLAAALVAGGSVSVPDWPEETTQAGAELAHLLPLFGGESALEEGRFTVTGDGTVHGVDLDLSDASELAPTLVALAALADGPSEITGIGHMRGHETDRLAALAAEINGLGGQVTETEDGLRIAPRPLNAGTWHSHEDHRMATAGALVGLAVEGVEVDDIGATGKTLPEFPALWRGMLAGDGS